MRCPAAIPAIALCAGISAGIFVSPPVQSSRSAAVSAHSRSQFLPRGARLLDGRAHYLRVRARPAWCSGAMQILRRATRRCAQCSIGTSPPGELQLFTNVEGRAAHRRVEGPVGRHARHPHRSHRAERLDGSVTSRWCADRRRRRAGERSDSAMARGPPRRISCHASKAHHVSRSGRRRRRAAAGVARRRARGVGQERQARRRHRAGARRWRKRWRRRARRSGGRSRRASLRGARDRRPWCPRF